MDPVRSILITFLLITHSCWLLSTLFTYCLNYFIKTCFFDLILPLCAASTYIIEEFLVIKESWIWLCQSTLINICIIRLLSFTTLYLTLPAAHCAVDSHTYWLCKVTPAGTFLLMKQTAHLFHDSEPWKWLCVLHPNCTQSFTLQQLCRPHSNWELQAFSHFDSKCIKIQVIVIEVSP